MDNFIANFAIARQVLIRDNFRRQVRNSDYPTEVEHFTDRNTQAGNPDNVSWGDYSVIGNQFSDGGGAALTVAIHHNLNIDALDAAFQMAPKSLNVVRVKQFVNSSC